MPRIALTTLASKSSILFLLAGISSFVISYIIESQILALIGLGLVFWAAIFTFIGQTRQVDANMLYKDLMASYTTYDRIISDFKCNGKGYLIPAFPKDVYLPAHLKGLKDIIVYISIAEKTALPNIAELAEGKFLLDNSKGVVISPPGLFLFNELETKGKWLNLTKASLEELNKILPQLIMDNYTITRGISMHTDGSKVYLRMVDSVYKNLYDVKNNLKSIDILGCPLASAVGCIIAKASGKPVILQSHRMTLDGSTIEIQFLVKEEMVK